MKLTKTILFSGIILFIIIIGLLRFHPWNSPGSQGAKDVVHAGPNDTARRELTIGFLPVTCHLTCPVTDFASKTTTSNTNFNSRLFTDFPTVASALEARQIQ